MRTFNWVATSTLVLVLGLCGAALAARPESCDSAAVAEVKAAIAEQCPCAGRTDEETGEAVAWRNHGQYVKCVTKARRRAADEAGLAKRCLKDVVPCAANSACGKKNAAAVACEVTTGACLDDPTPGDGTAEGTCDGGETTCDSDEDCAQTSCQVASSAEACTEMGGAASGLECCE